MQNPFNDDEIKSITLVKGLFDSNVRFRLLNLPQSVGMFLIENGIVSGGASASLFHGETPNDYDIYLDDMVKIQRFNDLLKDPEVMKRVKDVNEKYSVETLVDGKLVTSRAVTFDNSIQVVTLNTSSQRREFDYVHCMPWFDIKNQKYFISRNQYDSIKNKKLVKNPAYNPARTFNAHAREQKFLSRGWKL